MCPSLLSLFFWKVAFCFTCASRSLIKAPCGGFVGRHTPAALHAPLSLDRLCIFGGELVFF